MTDQNTNPAAEISEEEFNAYLGSSAKRLSKTRELAAKGEYIHISWLSALGALTPFAVLFWLAYRKWWEAFGITIAIIIVSNVLIPLLEFSTETYFMVSAVTGVMLGGVLPVLYVRHICKKIKIFKEQGKPIEASKTDMPSAAHAVGAILSLFVVGVLIATLMEGDLLATGLPECDSRAGKSEVAKVLENSPASKILNIEVYDIENIKETSYDDANGKRKCEGVAMTNGGKTFLLYSFEDRGSGEYWVEVFPVGL